MLWKFLFIIFLHHLLSSSKSDAFQVGLLNNTYVLINASTTNNFSETLQHCLCRLRSDSKWLGFNYFLSTNTCQFYLTIDRDRIINITSNRVSSFYFLPSPEQTTVKSTDSTPSSKTNDFENIDTCCCSF